VLFGGAILGLFSGLYYWWPKVFGKLLSEGLGKLNFWLMVFGLNLTFFPMHILGLEGMPRRYYTYPASLKLGWLNLLVSIGAFTIAASVAVFIVNVIVTSRKAKEAGADPWDARTLEWSTSSPPPEHNFDEIPVVHSLDDFWHRKYAEDRGGRVHPVPAGGAPEYGGGAEEHGGGGHGHGIHMPAPSYWPIVASLGLPLIGFGLIFHWWLSIVGAGVVVAGFYGWILEPSAE